MFPVIDLASSIANRPEALGTKEKLWLTPRPGVLLHSRPHLFKIGREGTGENWSERAACEIAALLGLPTALYELAEYEGKRGVITESFIPESGTLVLGNLILSRMLGEYDDAKTFNQLDYRISTVLQVVSRLNARPPITINSCAFGMNGIDYFIGYLIFDCLIGNTDRHHENWGFIINNADGAVDLHLAPTFDHASCLGRNEQDGRREMRLATRDMRATVEAYAGKARSAFYAAAPSSEILNCRELMAELARAYPETTALWARRIAALTDSQINAMFARIPADWISTPAVEFACRMLRCNRQMIVEVGRA